MMCRPSLTGARDAALLWLACGVALCVGWYVAFVVLGSAVDREHERTADVAAALRADSALLAQRSQFAADERALEERLARAQLDAAPPTAVARFVRLAAHIAAAHGAKLTSVDERTASPAAPSSAAQLGAVPFDEIPLDATLAGDYRSLLATMRELAASPLPMQLELTSLARTGDANALTAHLRVTLERFAGGATDSPAHSTPP